MDSDTDSQSASGEPSLIRGGPFYRAQQATRLILPNQWNLGRRITFAIALGWFPLILITVLFNGGGLVSLLQDYRIHSRILIAVPVLLFGQLLIEWPFIDLLPFLRNSAQRRLGISASL